MVQRTWENHEVPLLEAIVESHMRGQPIDDVEALAAATGLEVEVARRRLEPLHEAGYVTGVRINLWGEGFELRALRPTPEARRLVGQWPSGDGYEALLQLLNERIEAEEEPERRTRLERLRDGFLGVSREVGVSLLTAWAKSQAGLP